MEPCGSISGRCKECGRLIKVNNYGFNGLSMDSFYRLKMIIHHCEHKAFYPKQFTKYGSLFVLCAFFELLHLMVKIITFPAWWVHERC